MLKKNPRFLNPSAYKGKLWPVHGWLGLILVAVCWPLNWMLPGVRTAYLFFPLWLGYILVVDALVQVRTGTSLWTRSRKNFLLLFLISAPVWWLFELINLRTANWEYVGRELFSTLQFALLCTISFSVVVPAVFETAELIRSFPLDGSVRNGAARPATRAMFAGLFVIGLAMLAAVLVCPKNFYPFTWNSRVHFRTDQLLDGRPYFLEQSRNGDWRKMISLAFGALVCGFFWEMWNYYSFPKWIYHIPGSDSSTSSKCRCWVIVVTSRSRWNYMR